MTLYFPRSPSVPEEIFFEILKFVHPGAIWLFCRRVSRAWRHHVDGNIERFYKFHVGVVKWERERVNQICASGEPWGHLVQRLQADSLYVEIRWVHAWGDALPHASSLALRFKEIELPPGETTALGLPWDGKVTFEMEMPDTVTFGSHFAVIRIEHFIFPGFAPSRKDDCPAESEYLKPGTHTLQFDDYLVTYTLHFTVFSNHSSIGCLTIDRISVPLRSLLVFPTPHLVSTDISGSGSHAKLQYLSPLFSTVEEERELLPENVLARRQREEHEKWREGMKPLCEHCAVNPLDRWCEMWRCDVCCWREGVCIAHLAQERGSLGKRRNLTRMLKDVVAHEDYVDTVVEEGEAWGEGEGEGQESLGMDFRDLSGQTLHDDDGILDRFGQERLWLSKGYDVSTPPIFDFDEHFNVGEGVSNDDAYMDPIIRTQSAAPTTERQLGCKIRRASCCF